MDRRAFLQLLSAGAAATAAPVQALPAQHVVVLGEDWPGLALGNEALANTRLSPCSTFKIPLTLMALEEGLVTNPDQLLDVSTRTWSPQPWWTREMLDSWNRPHSLRSAFHASAIWFFRLLALQLGPERMAAYLRRFDYGNRDISFGIDNFWNAGDRGIRISPKEQWHFLSRVAHGGLALRRSSLKTALEVFVTERQGETLLRAKTGLGWRGPSQDSPVTGWYVGWVEGPDGVLPFASLSLGAGVDEMRRPRIDNARRLLRERGAFA